MNLPTEIFGSVVVVHTPEELTEDQSERLANYLSSLDRSCVIVDLDGTESLDSALLTGLLDAQEALRAQHGDLKVTTSNPINQKILEITRLEEHLEVFDTVVDAVKSFV